MSRINWGKYDANADFRTEMKAQRRKTVRQERQREEKERR